MQELEKSIDAAIWEYVFSTKNLKLGGEQTVANILTCVRNSLFKIGNLYDPGSSKDFYQDYLPEKLNNVIHELNRR